MTDTLPKAVRDQAERAEAFYKEAPPASEEGNPGGNPAAQNEGEPAPATLELDEDTAKLLPPQDDPRFNDPAYLRQRLSVVLGKYNHEVREVIPELRASLRAVEHERDQLRQQADQAPAQHEVSTDEAVQKLREEFGDTAADQIAALVRQETQPLHAEREQAQQAQQREQVADQERRFWRELAREVPNYQEIDHDPAFAEWLKGTDPMTGRARGELIGTAFNERDANRVARIMHAYEQESAQGQGQSSSPDRDVMPPERPASGSQPAPSQQGQVWTRKQIADAYQRITHGRMSDDEALALKAEIDAAVAEGRIQH